MSNMRFRVDLPSAVAWMSTNSLLETSPISEVQVTPAGWESTTTKWSSVHLQTKR